MINETIKKKEKQKIFNLYFVRHGETDFNVEGRFIGVSDQPLNKNGIDQAKKTANLLKKINPTYDVILTSPLKRASQTAEIIAKEYSPEIPIIYEDLLKERNYGVFEGKTPDEIKLICPEIIEQYQKDKPNVRPPNGELAKDVEDRVKILLMEKIPSTYKQYQNIILTTHLNPIRAALLLLHMAKPEIYYHKFKNAGVVEIQFNPKDPDHSKLINFDLT